MSLSQIPVAAVLGHPINHSKSPQLHNFWLSKFGVNGYYIPLDIDPRNFEKHIRSLPQLGFSHGGDGFHDGVDNLNRERDGGVLLLLLYPHHCQQEQVSYLKQPMHLHHHFLFILLKLYYLRQI